MLILLLVALLVVADAYRVSHQRARIGRTILHGAGDDSWQYGCKNTVKWLVSCIVGAAFAPGVSHSIGPMSELKDQSMVLQDVIFNVNDVDQEIKLFQETFQDTCVLIHSETNQKENYISSSIGFGPDTYKIVKSFIPGISSFTENGAHATITFHSPTGKSSNDADLKTVYEKGNGLQHVKIGTELLRLSKSLANGANIKYAYGWVDLDTVNEVPLQIVVGIARDPLMQATLRVSNLQQSKDFFIDKLGMKVLPFPLARTPGSEFEQPAPPGSVYVGYGVDTMGLLLVETKNGAPIQVGSRLEGFKIVVDDKIEKNLLPEATSLMFQDGKMKSITVNSPDGYKFVLQPYSDFEKTARTTSIRT